MQDGKVFKRLGTTVTSLSKLSGIFWRKMWTKEYFCHNLSQGGLYFAKVTILDFIVFLKNIPNQGQCY